MGTYKDLPQLINIQKNYGTGLVQTKSGKKLKVIISRELLNDVQLMDYVELKKSPVTHEWVVTDYIINFDVCKITE